MNASIYRLTEGAAKDDGDYQINKDGACLLPDRICVGRVEMTILNVQKIKERDKIHAGW